MREAGNFESSSKGNEYPCEKMIAEAAYFHAERRGFEPNNDMADWFQAEDDVKALIGTSR